jgi:hypothetical protein
MWHTRFSPGRVQPVSRVGTGLMSLLGDRLITTSDGGEEGVALFWLWNRDVVLISERLQLRICSHMLAATRGIPVKIVLTTPAVKNPILNATPSTLRLILGLIPRSLDLTDQAVLVRVCSILGLYALELQVGSQLVDIPVVVWCCNLGLPVFLDAVLQILAVCWLWKRNVMICQPSLKLGLMPFVVYYD